MRLWHYACSHGVNGIIADGGLLRPNPGAGIQKGVTEFARRVGMTGPVIALPVVWLTDLDVRTWHDAMILGLQADYTPCNRVEFRFRANVTTAVPWAEYSFDEPVAGYRALVELDRDPSRWWVSEAPIPGARFDARYVGPLKPIVPSYKLPR